MLLFFLRFINEIREINEKAEIREYLYFIHMYLHTNETLLQMKTKQRQKIIVEKENLFIFKDNNVS